jgi:hypothetical protein
MGNHHKRDKKTRYNVLSRHRVGRVLGFISSLPNWDSPTPSPSGECAPPPFGSGGGAHLLAREGVGESQFRRGDIHCGTLYIYVLCELWARGERIPAVTLPPATTRSSPPPSSTTSHPWVHLHNEKKERKKERSFIFSTQHMTIYV